MKNGLMRIPHTDSFQLLWHLLLKIKMNELTQSWS